MRLELVRGRWFEAADDALDWDPVVINQRLANELFGSEDPLGKNIGNPEEKRQARVVGIITEYRENGELFEPENYLLTRRKLTGVAEDAMLHLVIRVRPGTTAVFEEQLMARLQATARGTSFEIKPLAQVRASFMRICMAPLLAIGVVAAFLMIMVSLGLVGVVWQNVTQRTTEIGLRRALGGTATAIHAQVLGELVVITSVGLLLGTALVAQLPLLGVMTFVGTQVFLIGLGTSLALIYLLTLLCGLYPSMLASKIQPAEALHYE
jgi:putative ABC transport system permease protein